MALVPLLAYSAPLTLTPLNLDQKIGQMLVVATMVNPASNPEFVKNCPYHLEPEYVKQMIKKYQIGGVIFMGSSNPKKQLAMANELQQLSEHPLLLFQDAEWGLSMRMTQNVITYPKAMTLGALSASDEHLLQNLGKTIGMQCNAIGIHSTLSPVCDVNTNPKNPIINRRSFGESAENVARKAILIMQGLQQAHSLTCAKHFPGHGDTSIDSHYNLPYIPYSKEYLKKHELVPFQKIITAGVDAIMLAHLNVPALTGQNGLPTTLSKQTIDMLRKDMHFDGLIITDGLGMRGITNQWNDSEIAINALLAGNDILLCPVEVPTVFHAIKQAVHDGIILEQQIDESVARIIRAKNKAFIKRSLSYNQNDLTSAQAQELKKLTYEAAITVACNENNYLPLHPTTQPLPIITIGHNHASFVQELQKQQTIIHYSLSHSAHQQECEKLLNKLQHASQVLISLHIDSRTGMIENAEAAQKIDPAYVWLINSLGSKATVILFGNPYNLAKFQNSRAIIVAYENEPEAQEAAAKTIFGLHQPHGQLPVTACEKYPAGLSLTF